MTFYDYSPDLVKDKGSEQANTTGDTGDFGDEKVALLLSALVPVPFICNMSSCFCLCFCDMLG